MSQDKQLEITVEAPPQSETSTITKEVWMILKSTQCPLMPDTYERSNGKLIAPYYYNDEFWIEDEKDDTKARIVEFPAENPYESSKCNQFKNYVTFTKTKTKKTAKRDAKLMLAVDEYVKEVRVNRSYELHTKLHVAMAEKRDDKDDNDASNDAYKKLVPSWIGRMAFIAGFLTTALNGYFIVHGLNLALNGRYSTWTMNVFGLIMSICELVLYSNILLGNVLTMFFTFIIQSCLGGTSYVQTKAIAQNLRDLTTLSILRYMPSVEIVTNFVIHWRQSFATISTDLHLTIHNSCVDPERRNVCDVLFSIPVFIIETCAPLLSIYALLVKMKALGFVVEGEPFASWTGYGQYIAFFAFLNQVSGLRVLRKIETSSIQHFVFSGADASLDADELLLLDDWWNVTVLSAVSNLRLSWYDNMVFWYSLNPQKIQLLLKHHSNSDNKLRAIRTKVKENDNTKCCMVKRKKEQETNEVEPHAVSVDKQGRTSLEYDEPIGSMKTVIFDEYNSDILVAYDKKVRQLLRKRRHTVS